MSIRLLGLTNGDESLYYAYCVLHLTPEHARFLLGAWPVVQQIHVQFGRGHTAVEFGDSLVAYYENVGVGNDGLEPGVWYAVPEGFAKDVEHSRDSFPTVRCTRGGVQWQSNNKYSSGKFDTPEMTWEELEAVARGRTRSTHYLNGRSPPC
jgi:hypothetical protein